MRRASANVPSYWMVGQTIDHMRLDAEMPNNFCLLMVVGPTHEPLGVVPLATLDATGLISQRLSMPISCVYRRTWIRKTLPSRFANAVWCRRRWWTSRGGWWVRSTSTISSMLSTKKGRRSPEIRRCPRGRFLRSCDRNDLTRFSWLLVNLMTAVRIDRYRVFDAAIEKLVALAILIPIVASRRQCRHADGPSPCAPWRLEK